MSAIISADGRYRYRLTRHVTGRPDSGFLRRGLLFVMLNPSTADAETDDPTIRRCIGFTRAWGYDYLKVGNLYAYRTSSPRELWAARERGVDIVGPDNDSRLSLMASSAAAIVIAWGVHAGKDPERAKRVYVMMSMVLPVCRIGSTRDGHPSHPLMLRKDLALQPANSYCEVNRTA